MLLRTQDGWMPDDFAHEVSLVIELAPASDGVPQLAVFNSCSHAGLPTIVAEVLAAFPGRAIASYVGGLHLVRASDEDVLRVADAIESARIGQLLTGHCTGAHALELLQRRAPCRIVALRPGLCVTL
jgi:7,8-dihydropterin-6-yl-methyl-4-(beta-D-ribofuranosyl)aminobenzene 5'-phosphate synthase